MGLGPWRHPSLDAYTLGHRVRDASLTPFLGHGFLGPFEGFPDASPGVLQGTRIKTTKGGVCIEELQKLFTEPATPIPVTGRTPFLGRGFLGPFD